MDERIRTVFWNNAEQRLRAGWRILVTIAIMMGVFLPVQWALRPLVPDDWTRDQAIGLLISCFAVVATAVLWFTRTRIDKRSFISLGLDLRRPVLRDIGAGFLISGILVAVIVGIEFSFGWLTFELEGISWETALKQAGTLFLVSGLVVAWWENLFFVSYLFLNVRDGSGFWWSAAINCLVAGLVHGMNPNASVAAVLGIMLIHSYELFGFVRTRNLWLILGVHAGWNFFQGLAGFPVSGNTGIQALAQNNTTPTWLGGGEFGPEAGALVLLTTLLAYGLITLYTKLTREDTDTREPIIEGSVTPP